MEPDEFIFIPLLGDEMAIIPRRDIHFVQSRPEYGAIIYLMRDGRLTSLHTRVSVKEVYLILNIEFARANLSMAFDVTSWANEEAQSTDNDGVSL